ncbi:MAG: branched-chain amino acid ABC transporter permease, partial [Aphanocapsa feldmannii 277cI]
VLLTGAHPLLVAPVAMALTALLAVAIDRLFYRPFRSSPAIMLMIASLGMMLMIRSVVRFIWGVQLQSLVRGIEQPLAWLEPLRLLPKHLLIITGAVVLMVAVHLLLTRTKIGKAMRATSDNAELARVCGIDTETVIRMTWILGSVLAVAAGVFLAIDTHVETMMGFRLLVPMFAAAILGGIGKPYGAVAGGLVIGIVEELSAYPWIGTEPLLSPSYKAGVAFTIMVAMLIWRPQGLLHGRRF